MLIDGNPNWERVQELAMFFQAIDEATGNAAEVCMMNGVVSQYKFDQDHPCGTPACHAGWFGLYSDDEGGTNYSRYAREIAEHLGFEGYDFSEQPLSDKLSNWAEENPEIWGNPHGAGIFCSRRAFGIEPYSDIHLKNIADHWFSVAERLYNLQILNKPLEV